MIVALALLAATAPTVPQLKAQLFGQCSRGARTGAPPNMQHLIPAVCTCFVSRISAGKSAGDLQRILRSDAEQAPVGKQCIRDVAQADAARGR